MCETVQKLVDFQPAAVVLDEQLASSTHISKLREALSNVPFIARADVSRYVENVAGRCLSDDGIRMIKGLTRQIGTRQFGGMDCLGGHESAGA